MNYKVKVLRDSGFIYTITKHTEESAKFAADVFRRLRGTVEVQIIPVPVKQIKL